MRWGLDNVNMALGYATKFHKVFIDRGYKEHYGSLDNSNRALGYTVLHIFKRDNIQNLAS